MNEEEQYKNEIEKINLKIEINTQKENNIKIIEKTLKEKNKNLQKDTIEAQQKVEQKLEKEYEESLNNKTNELIKQIKNKLKTYEIEIKQKLSKKYETSQKAFEQKFTQMSALTKSKIVSNKYGMKELSKIKCQTIHPGVKCQNCFKEPIIGIRYKCTACSNYNLCSACEEKNSSVNAHPHNFIKIRKNKNSIINNNNININIMDIKSNNNINNNNSLVNNDNNLKEIDYSYECTVNNLTAFEYQGTNESSLSIILKNNGKEPWIKGNTLLKFDKEESEAQIGEDIMLTPQLSGQVSNYKILFNNISNLNVGVYKICYKFTVNGKQYGNNLYTFLIICFFFLYPYLFIFYILCKLIIY